MYAVTFLKTEISKLINEWAHICSKRVSMLPIKGLAFLIEKVIKYIIKSHKFDYTLPAYTCYIKCLKFNNLNFYIVIDKFKLLNFKHLM